jgi:hypothetical protein
LDSLVFRLQTVILIKEFNYNYQVINIVTHIEFLIMCVFYCWLFNISLLPLILWIGISIRARCTILCDKVCQWLFTGRWFSLVSSTNKTDCHDITEILLKVVLNISLWEDNSLLLNEKGLLSHFFCYLIDNFQK